MPFHADPQIQRTPGDRGSTTRRKSTRSVLGPEGAWIAQMKEELANRPAGWLVMKELTWEPRSWEKVGDVRTFCYGRFDTEEKANAAAAEIVRGEASVLRGPNGTCRTTRVWVEREVK